jgi:hypothetical protein
MRSGAVTLQDVPDYRPSGRRQRQDLCGVQRRTAKAAKARRREEERRMSFGGRGNRRNQSAVQGQRLVRARPRWKDPFEIVVPNTIEQTLSFPTNCVFKSAEIHPRRCLVTFVVRSTTLLSIFSDDLRQLLTSDAPSVTRLTARFYSSQCGYRYFRCFFPSWGLWPLSVPLEIGFSLFLKTRL